MVQSSCNKDTGILRSTLRPAPICGDCEISFAVLCSREVK